jgi:hypothetical protein
MKTPKLAKAFLERVPLHLDEETFKIMHSETNTHVKDLLHLIDLFNAEKSLVCFQKRNKLKEQILYQLQCNRVLSIHNEKSKKNETI